MAWLERWELDSTPPWPPSGVSLRLLRHLVSACHLRFGARVLEVAATAPGFAPAFADLGIETVELTPGDACRGDGTMPAEERDARGFDLVLAHGGHPFFGNLRARPTVAAVSEWVSRLKPGGALVLLAARDADGRPAGHALSCCRGLLARFSGTVDCEEISEGTLWQRLRGEAPEAGWFATTLRLPHDGAVLVPDFPLHEPVQDRACCARAVLRSADRGRAAA
ncbi:MAG: hypothetical protein WD069_22795 [Planctomycetales bacterium]